MFRYLYVGNFTNISPAAFLGAYHGSELPLIFGTDGEFRGPSTKEENETSAIMENTLAAFASGGAAGIEKTGWPRCEDARTCRVREFGGSPVVKDVDLQSLAAVCLPALNGEN